MATQGGLLPHRPPAEADDGETQVVELGTERMHDVFDALGSETAIEVFAAFRDEPTTASDAAERADTSLQNAQYHLEKLCDAGLVRRVDTWYSSRGFEMDVYAAVPDRVVFTMDGERVAPVEGSRPERGGDTDDDRAP